MEFAFFLKKLATQFILPPFNLFLLALLGLLTVKRWPRFSRVALWTSLVTLILLSTPFVARTLIHSLYSGAWFDAQAAQSAGAIVVLGGGLRNNTPEYGDTLSQFTLDRVRYAATVSKQTNLPILTTGGAVVQPQPEAEVMANALRDEFGAQVRWIENKSLDTADNLRFSAAILKHEGISRIVLVTHDIHMRRALKYCETSGLECVPAPVSYIGSEGRPWISEFPNASSLNYSSLALYEMVGYMVALIR